MTMEFEDRTESSALKRVAIPTHFLCIDRREIQNVVAMCSWIANSYISGPRDEASMIPVLLSCTASRAVNTLSIPQVFILSSFAVAQSIVATAGKSSDTAVDRSGAASSEVENFIKIMAGPISRILTAYAESTYENENE